MKNKKILTAIATLSFVFCTSANALNTYFVEKSLNDEIFIINGELFKAKTYCFSVYEGDQVIFTEGRPSGACVSAEFYDLTTSTKCRVWCE